jgi:hypothetical protein
MHFARLKMLDAEIADLIRRAGRVGLLDLAERKFGLHKKTHVPYLSIVFALGGGAFVGFSFSYALGSLRASIPTPTTRLNALSSANGERLRK